MAETRVRIPVAVLNRPRIHGAVAVSGGPESQRESQRVRREVSGVVNDCVSWRATVSRLIVKALARSRKREPRDLLHGATRSYDARKRSMSAVSRASAGAGAGRANHAGSGRPFLMDQVPVAAPRLSTTGLSIPPPLRM